MSQHEEEGARSFTRAIEMVSDGALVSEASDALHKLVNALQDEALATSDVAKGELTLKIKIGVEPNGVASVAYDIKAKEPTPHRPKGVLWVTKGGNLTPHNPRQQKLPLREVGGEERAPREVESSSAKAREV